MPRRVWLVRCIASADGRHDKFAAMRVAELGGAPQIASAKEAIRLCRRKMTDVMAEREPDYTIVTWDAQEENSCPTAAG